jgi:large subunit ribosomal protein L17
LCSDYVVFSHATLPGGGEVIEKPAKKAAAKKAPAKKAAPAKKPAAKIETPEIASADDKPLPDGAHAPIESGEAPRGYKIKGNADSGLYHVPGSAFYDRTVAEIWFKTAEDAEAAGFQLPPSQREEPAEDGDKS